MADKILDTIKNGAGILQDNVGFDAELLLHINSAKSGLVQLGVTELNLAIDEETEWPVFGNDTVDGQVKLYMAVKVKSMFDPTASESINRVFANAITELEGRIAHEMEEINA